MTPRIALGLLLAGLSLSAGAAQAQDTTSARNPSGPAVTTSPDHKAEALKHTQAAIDAGKTGSASAVADHAQEALTHAQALATSQPSDKINDAVKSLEDAVSKGKSGDADGATKAAQEALEKLQNKS